MKKGKKKHTRASLNLYLIAGLYLLYIDYSLISKWGEIEPSKHIIVAIAAIIFTVFAIGIMGYSIKGLIDMKKTNEILIKEIKEEEDKKVE